MASQISLYQATRGKLSYKDSSGNIICINNTPTAAVIHLRPRGLHMDEPGILISGIAVSASLLDFGLYFYHNAKELINNGVGPYFYLAKLEHHLEARWWNDVFSYSEEALRIPPGSIRATVMIETFPAIFHVEEILYELKDRCAGLIASRCM
jgi:malate synthase